MDKKSMTLYVIIAVSLSSFIVSYTSNVSVIALPQLASAFNLNNIMQNWVINAYLLTIAVLSVPLGKIGSKYGLKRSFLISSIIFFIGALGTALSFNTLIFYGFRVFQAIGGAGIFVTAVALLVTAVPDGERGKALGINIGAVYIGFSASPVIGGSLTYNFGWQSIFLVSLPVILLIILILMFKVPDEWKMGENHLIDLKGSIFYMVGILIFMFGFTMLNQLIGVILTIIGGLILIGFALYELNQKYPIFEIRLFKNTKFLSSNLSSIISYFAIYAVTTILNYHFQYLRGWDAQMTGLVLIVTPLLQAIVTPYAGKLSDCMNPQLLAAIGMSFVTISLVIFTLFTVDSPLWVVIFAMALEGIGFGIFASPNSNTIMSSVPVEKTGMASASMSTMCILGQTLSMGMLTVIFAFVMGNVVITPSVYPLLTVSCKYTLILSTILGGGSVLASLVGMKSNDKLNTDSIR